MTYRKKTGLIPKGFMFAAAEAAIKKPGRKDIAMIYSENTANIAGTFTTNKVKAAPVQLDMKKIVSGRGQAIIINSGNANACTGKKGLHDASEIVSLTAKNLRIEPSLVYVCSTGVIGTPLPMTKMRSKIPQLVQKLSKTGLKDVAMAIMTTDTFPKIQQRNVNINGLNGTIIGICKGAGMICPDMATMLCFILTDIAIEKQALKKALKDSVNKSFNRITIDGDMSTNDTALIMANGMLGNQKLDLKSPEYQLFKKALDEITLGLCMLIVKDGEGATKFIELDVENAVTDKDAEKAAFAVANSNLVKTAVYGNDANWGRIMSALGQSGIALYEEKVNIQIGNISVVKNGCATGRDSKANDYLKKNKDIKIIINLNSGKGFARVFTCDLTEKYVKVNARYRT